MLSTVELWLQQARDHGLIVLDTAGVITGWLAGAESILGYTPDEAIGQHIALIFTHDDRQKGYPDYELKIAAEDHYSEDSRWHARKDGTRIWVSGSVTAVRDEAGAVTGFVKVLRDMTDDRAHTERFEHEVSALANARDETRKFLRNLGHEIRNPLAVLSNVALILDRLVEEERAKRAVGQLRNQLQVLGRLADDLMDVTRLELGKVQLETTPLDLRTVLEDAAAGMQVLAGEKAIQLEAVLPPSPLPVEVDLPRIHQVIFNLLTNAIKYTHNGGSIWIKASQEGDEIVCRITDTGIGIFPPVLPRLFDLFTQAPEGEQMRAGGVGLGLPLVRQIVELHSGTVQAKSPGLGKGSEFSFRLPVLKS
ncbi:PAS domain-containing sensor histidine kinase [Ramlibacter sp.]|uniref:PAS domain-containing sensor histidine kinase n=1 Tax=Ramlibacter sp. TaxID=1917967 RepID=UPI0017FC5337|nr:PAS domain-containing sensor histidine kinase [Ramlibacter sp.]MBA2675742.1 PAS domain-containing sensor histidine kinase [Ramlibacter sp.]